MEITRGFVVFYLRSAASFFSMISGESAKFKENSMFATLRGVKGPRKFLMILSKEALNSAN